MRTKFPPQMLFLLIMVLIFGIRSSDSLNFSATYVYDASIPSLVISAGDMNESYAITIQPHLTQHEEERFYLEKIIQSVLQTPPKSNSAFLPGAATASALNYSKIASHVFAQTHPIRLVASSDHGSAAMVSLASCPSISAFDTDAVPCVSPLLEYSIVLSTSSGLRKQILTPPQLNLYNIFNLSGTGTTASSISIKWTMQGFSYYSFERLTVQVSFDIVGNGALFVPLDGDLHRARSRVLLMNETVRTLHASAPTAILSPAEHIGIERMFDIHGCFPVYPADVDNKEHCISPYTIYRIVLLGWNANITTRSAIDTLTAEAIATKPPTGKCGFYYIFLYIFLCI